METKSIEIGKGESMVVGGCQWGLGKESEESGVKGEGVDGEGGGSQRRLGKGSQWGGRGRAQMHSVLDLGI